MRPAEYDVIVVGGRCAGSSTARLLAGKGLSVLIVDRATFPSDTVSTHCVTTVGCLQLQRWGLFDRILATNVEHVPDFTVTLNGMEMPNPIPLTDDMPRTVSPRRFVLDKLLLDAAAEAGAHVREGVTIKDLTRVDGRVNGVAGHDAEGEAFEARAGVVIGADGAASPVARMAGAEMYDERESKGSGFYSYFRDWPGQSVELAFGEAGAVGVFPTNDDLVCVFAGRRAEDFTSYKRDVEGTHRAIVRGVSERMGDWLDGCQREERFYGWSAVPGFFRVPYGPGWALVGDAGYHKDPVTGQGISDAFRDAELLAGAVADALGGARAWDDALSEYQVRRDGMSRDVYAATQDIAQFPEDGNVAMEAFMRFGIAMLAEATDVAAWKTQVVTA